MASRTTLNEKNLEALGATRLAALLMTLSAGNGGAKRQLRIELAAAVGPADVAREVRKRLTTIARSRSFIDWQKRAAFIADLQTQREAIVGKIATADPAEALELMWRFMGLATNVLDRCDDDSGRLWEVFRSACEELGALAVAAAPDPLALADQVFEALRENDYGQFDGLIAAAAPALGDAGLKRLQGRLAAFAEEPLETPAAGDRVVIGWGMTGPLYADQVERSHRDSTVRLGLMAIADAQGDADAFIAQYDEKVRKVPAIAAKIAVRLIDAGRPQEALAAIEASDRARGHVPEEWVEAKLAALEALGRAEDAQALRWERFEHHLDGDRLRAYLKRLPDFDDLEVEERALALVHGLSRFHEALAFLVQWPAPELAADLVVSRREELDGDRYEILSPAAEALAAKHPLAATLALRAMIDFTLHKGRSSRYRHAARHLATCEALAAAIPDFGAAPSHETYLAALKTRHGRKSAFWSLTDCSKSKR